MFSQILSHKERCQLMKRMAFCVLVLAIVLGIGAPLAAAAPEATSQNPTAQIQWQQPWYYRWQPFPVWPGWGYVPWPGTGLQYQLSYSQQENQLVLTVVNPTDKRITVTMPTGQKVDFVLWRDGQIVWRASAGKVYTQILTQESFQPYEAKVYKETLPWLPSGLYFAQAYYLGETQWSPVASTYVWLQAYSHDPLQYSVDYLGPSSFNPTPRLRVTIKNTSGRDITLPYQYGYQVLVKKAGSNNYLPNVGIGQSIGTIANGAARYVFLNLKGLEPGLYQADVRSNVSNASQYSVVAQTWFYVW